MEYYVNNKAADLTKIALHSNTSPVSNTEICKNNWL